MLRALMDKVANIKSRRVLNVSKEMKILRKNQKWIILNNLNPSAESSEEAELGFPQEEELA